MCDPFSLAIAATTASLAATGVGMYQQSQAIDSQNAADAAWRKWQDQQKRLAQQKEEEMRRQAQGARDSALDKLGAGKQQADQSAEATRLSDFYDQGQTDVNTATVNDALLSGQQDGGTEFKTDVAQRLTKAAQEARARIKALAEINSYGGSMNGLANRNSEIFDASGQQIELQNNMRRGNMAAYGVAKAVTPGQNRPVTDYASGIGNALAGIAGKAWGQSMGGKV